MNCTLCGAPIVLVPSAQERAVKYGGTANDYTRLFTSHSSCFLEKRNRDTSAAFAATTHPNGVDHEVHRPTS